MVSQNMIRKSSDLIREKMDETSIQKQHMVDLPDTLPFTFFIYYQWLRTGKLYTRNGGDDAELNLLGAACSFGYDLHDNDFIDAVHDAIFQYSMEKHAFLGVDLIETGTLIYINMQKNIPINSPFVGLVYLQRINSHNGHVSSVRRDLYGRRNSRRGRQSVRHGCLQFPG